MATVSALLEKTTPSPDEQELLSRLTLSVGAETIAELAGLLGSRPLDEEQTALISQLLERRQECLDLRDFLLNDAFELDRLGHQLELAEPLMHELCLAADMTTGWGPGCPDWEQHKTSFLAWFWQWLWQGACPTCHGQGRLPWVEYRQPDGSYEREENVACFHCQGSGHQEEQ